MLLQHCLSSLSSLSLSQAIITQNPKIRSRIHIFLLPAMALEQAVAVNNTLRLHQNPTPFPSLIFRSLNLNAGRRFSPDARIKCSSDSNEIYEYERYATQYPRPPEIQWKKELCNTVQLIGVVGAPVQIKHLASGKVVAWSRLAVKKSQTDTMWINLTFWDELAHVASEYVGKGDQIYVCGRLVSDTVETDDGKQQIYYKVVVQQLNFIERNVSSSPVSLYNGDSTPEKPKLSGLQAQRYW